MKVSLRLQERKTISTSNILVDYTSNLYKTNYLKLIQIFLNHKLSNKKLKNSSLYKEALDRLEVKYADLLSGKSPISDVNFKNKLKKNLSKKTIYEIASIPNNKIAPYVLQSDTALNAFKSAGLNEEDVGQEISTYLDERSKGDIKLYLELSLSGEDFHGEMDFRSMSISVNYNSDIFKTVLFFESDIKKFFNKIEEELVLTKRTVYHEFQHLFANIVQGVTGYGTYGSGPRSTTMGEIPQNDPEEVGTYAQNIVTLFNEMVDILSKQKEMSEEELENIKLALLKKLSNSPLSSEQKKIFDGINKTNIKKHIEMIERSLKIIKSFNKKFYNYTLDILFSSVRGGIVKVDPLTLPLSQRYGRQIDDGEALKEAVDKKTANKIRVLLR
jgi:hypothetical protein